MADVMTSGKSYEELKSELRETEKKRLDFERAMKDLDHNFAEESRKRQRRELVSEREPERKRFVKQDEDDKPKVQSTVVSLAPIESSKSENETDNKNEQTTSKESAPQRARGLGDKTRNRNLFGKLLFGTLNKFQQESGKTTEQAARRQEIENKVEDKVAAERKEMLERNAKGLEDCAEKVRVLREALHKLTEERAMNNLTATWDKHAALLTNFIKTNTEPAVYYLPKKHNEKTREMVPEKPVVEEEPVVIDRKKDRDETSDDEGSPPPEERNGEGEDNKEKASDEKKEKEDSSDDKDEKAKDEAESEKKEKEEDNGDDAESKST